MEEENEKMRYDLVSNDPRGAEASIAAGDTLARRRETAIVVLRTQSNTVKPGYD